MPLGSLQPVMVVGCSKLGAVALLGTFSMTACTCAQLQLPTVDVVTTACHEL
jgi:hypothetical protein